MKKPRNRQLQKIVRGPKLTKDQLDDTEATIAFYIANVLRQTIISRKSKDIGQRVRKCNPDWSNEFIESLVIDSEKYVTDLKKMLWSLEELSTNRTNHPQRCLFYKFMEACERNDKKEMERLDGKWRDVDESLVESYNKKLREGLQLFLDIFFDIEEITMY